MSILPPFNLTRWIEENRHLLQPPVGNRNVYIDSEDYIVMVVAGPNARKDYHYNETEEIFYQIEGEISVFVQEKGVKKEMKLSAGDMYLNPAKVPHSPARKEGSIGLVIERKRAGKGFTDGLIWYCEQCNHTLHEAYFELHNIETDFLPHFELFYSSEFKRTCKNCEFIMEAPSKFKIPK